MSVSPSANPQQITSVQPAFLPTRRNEFVCRMQFPVGHPYGVDARTWECKDPKQGHFNADMMELFAENVKGVEATLVMKKTVPTGRFSERVSTLTYSGPIGEALKILRNQLSSISINWKTGEME